MQRSNRRGLFWPVLVSDRRGGLLHESTSRPTRLLPQGLPHEVYGDWMRFTLVHNPGAAFGLHLGSYSRWIFMVLTIVALVILGRLYTSRRVAATSCARSSLALVCGGAVGNLIDRITLAVRRGGLHRHRLWRLAMADVQRRRHGGEHRRVSARLGAVG